ncbi:MAG: S1C family serine protease, partial [Eubacterium sp.]|nr:S1C family serine protease [Eubacterium sp.]
MKESSEGKESRIIREQIKEKPLSKKRILIRIAIAAVTGLVFGACAVLAFAALMPSVGHLFGVEDEFTIPGEEAESSDAESADASETTEVIVEEKDVDLDDYQKLKVRLYDVGRKAQKSVVTVTGVTSDTDLFSSEYESVDDSWGIIIGKKGSGYLILTEYDVLSEADSIRVTFNDDSSAEATLQGYDANVGIAVVLVDGENVPQGTSSTVKVANIGNSKTSGAGRLVVAVGSPLGSVGSISAGAITDVKGTLGLDDANYTLFTTDMVADSSSGVLLNTDGEIIGLVNDRT